jgi:hypothetical protein
VKTAASAPRRSRSVFQSKKSGGLPESTPEMQLRLESQSASKSGVPPDRGASVLQKFPRIPPSLQFSGAVSCRLASKETPNPAPIGPPNAAPVGPPNAVPGTLPALRLTPRPRTPSRGPLHSETYSRLSSNRRSFLPRHHPFLPFGPAFFWDPVVVEEESVPIHYITADF